MNIKIIKIILIIMIQGLILNGCGPETIDSFGPRVDYKIINNLTNETIYYETEYYDCEKLEILKKEGIISKDKSIDVGICDITVENNEKIVSAPIISLKIYEDETKQKLIYSYDGTKKGGLYVFKYIEENSIVFEMTEDKIIK